MKHICLHISLSFLAILTLVSCQEDNSAYDSAEGGAYFSIRALADDEVAIESLWAIYFKASAAGGTYKYYNQYKCVSPTTSNGVHTYELKNYPTATNPSTDNARMKVVFVANVESLVSSSWNTSTTMSAIENSLIVSSTNSGIWGVASTMASNKAPMYYCTSELRLIKDELTTVEYLENSNVTPCGLERLVAKFTINNRKTLSTGSKNLLLNLAAVRVVNGNDRGFLSTNLNSKTTVAVPASAVKSTVADATVMTPSNATVDISASEKNVAVQQVIFYTFPAINSNKTTGDLNNESNTYIRLSGTVSGQSGTLNYMLPIPGTLDGNKKILTPGDVVRNHHYIYTIDGVKDNLTFTVTINEIPWTPAEVPVDLGSE
ncbi:hypothetical protein [Bacteroides sp. 519]|uniref:hypothetical protein n=1 Tax=Bacteroides sp. 519 TaxID=2302937 RepID=UPI0013D5A38C|nr:hypothetical protein [Bacteroides sp. 519]NDV59528.1 hypothetical protein [Bacteroides sp. 519]